MCAAPRHQISCAVGHAPEVQLLLLQNTVDTPRAGGVSPTPPPTPPQRTRRTVGTCQDELQSRSRASRGRRGSGFASAHAYPLDSELCKPIISKTLIKGEEGTRNTGAPPCATHPTPALLPQPRKPSLESHLGLRLTQDLAQLLRAHLNAGESCGPGRSSAAALPEGPRTACLSCCKNNGAGNVGRLGEGPSRHPPKPPATGCPRSPGLLQGLPALGLRDWGLPTPPGTATTPHAHRSPRPRPLLPPSCLPAHHVAEVPGLQPAILPRFQKGCLPGRAPSCLGAPESTTGERPLWVLEGFHPWGPQWLGRSGL